jgi:hypothetical protein
MHASWEVGDGVLIHKRGIILRVCVCVSVRMSAIPPCGSRRAHKQQTQMCRLSKLYNRLTSVSVVNVFLTIPVFCRPCPFRAALLLPRNRRQHAHRWVVALQSCFHILCSCICWLCLVVVVVDVSWLAESRVVITHHGCGGDIIFQYVRSPDVCPQSQRETMREPKGDRAK